MNELKKIDRCRLCDSKNLVPIFSLGDQYVATTFLKSLDEKKEHKKYALNLVICGPGANAGCGFVQLEHTLDRAMMFDTYWYRSGINQTMKDALSEIVSQLPLYVDLQPGDVVCDVGCNDGTLLSFYPKDLRRIGIDPAKNMAQFSTQHANEIAVDYFSAQAFQSVSSKKAKVVTSIAMFYSVIDPLNFAKSVSEILDEDGVWIMQMSSLPLMIKNRCYDNIVHEHIGYYTVEVIETFIRQFGLYVVDGEVNDINAGSVRLYIKKKPGRAVKGLDHIRLSETEVNYRDLSVYQDFTENVKKETSILKDFLKDCNPDNTCFYGASTKGNVILQYAGIGPQHAFGIAERNPLKYGHYTLGSDLKIVSEDEMRARKPKNVIVLPYHFRHEMVQREQSLLKQGSRMIFPLPNFEIVGSL